LKNTRETIEKIAQAATAQGRAGGAAKGAKAKRELRDDFETTVLATRMTHAGPHQPLRITEGARVRLKDVREPARVTRFLSNDRIEVEAGFLRLQVSRDDVIEVLPETGGAAASCRKA